MIRRYVVLCALGAVLSGCGNSEEGGASASATAPAQVPAAGATSPATPVERPEDATTPVATPKPTPVEQTAAGIARYSDAPWALVGTARSGRALVVFPQTTRPACGKLRATATPTSTAVAVRVRIDYSACKPSKSDDQVVIGPVETTPVRPVIVPLGAPLRGRTVLGDRQVMGSQHVDGGAADFRGLAPEQAFEVAKTLGTKLVVKGSQGGRAIVRQSPKAGSGSTVSPAGGYRVWIG